MDEAKKLATTLAVDLVLVDHQFPKALDAAEQLASVAPVMVMAQQDPVRILAAKSAGASGFIPLDDESAFKDGMRGALAFLAREK